MITEHKFTPLTRMSDLIKEDASLLSSVSRFGISLGFGNKAVHEACEANNIDTDTFLAVINFLSEGNLLTNKNLENISIETVISYLSNAHDYFLKYKLPSIRVKLMEAVSNTEQDEAYKPVFIKFFDEYYQEVQRHMEFEDKTVFPYVLKLISGKKSGDFKIADFEEHHSNIDSKLADLKNILVKYYPSKGVNYALNDVLFELLSCENDLATHNQVEDFFFVPLIETIEQKMRKK